MAAAQVLLPNTMPQQQQHDDKQEQLLVQREEAFAVFDDSYDACFNNCCNPFENLLPESIALKGQAFDAIVVRSSATGRVANSDFFLNFDHPTVPFPPTANTVLTNPSAACEALLEIVDERLGNKVYFTIVHDPIQKKNQLREPVTKGEKKNCCAVGQEGIEPLQLLAKMLKPGKNPVRYLFRNSDKGVLGVAKASIYLWNDNDRLVVCDVDGTITKTNVRGIIDTLVTERYSYCHDRVCRFLSTLKQRASFQAAANGAQVNFLYLSSRPLVLAEATRKFLSNVRQPLGDIQEQPDTTPTTTTEHKLPEGPLIGFGGRLSEVMKMELVTHSVHLFKASALMDQVVTPFCSVSANPQEKHQSLFVAGFGNTFMDVQAYHMAGLDLSKIYLIDKKSRISCLDADASLVAQQEIVHLEKSQQSKRRRSSRRISWRPKLRISGSSLLSSTSMEGSSSHSRNNSSHSRNSLSGSLNNDGSSSSFGWAGDDATPMEQRPSLKHPMPRKSYKKLLGTSFLGYHDDGLHNHVLAE